MIPFETQKDGFLHEFIEKYFNRRVEIHRTDGVVMRGRVGWLAEPDDFWEDDDETGEGMDFGFDFDDIEIDGEKLSYGMSLTHSHVASYLPLEGENTEEFINAHF